MDEREGPLERRGIAEEYLEDAYGDQAEDWRIEELSGDDDTGHVSVTLGRYEASDDEETQVELAEGHGETIAAAIDAALGRTPDDAAQRYVEERIPNSGWKVDEVMGNIDFGMVTVVLGQYLKSGDMEHRVAGREGHGTTIEAAVDDALGMGR